MGIKFQCPNGHTLNVKSFLAGKRGICPQCQTRFVIPTESGGQAQPAPRKRGKSEADWAESELEFESSLGQPTAAPAQTPVSPPAQTPVSPPAAPTTLPQPASAPQPQPAATAPPEPTPAPAAGYPAGQLPSAAPAQPRDPIAESPSAVWYVRPASGGQFGPAMGEILRKWIAEGRVAADSLVWREGWPEWQQAGQVLPQLAGMSAVAPPPLGAGAESFTPGSASYGATPGSTRIRPRRGSRQLTIALVVFMALVAVLLVVVFVWVLRRQSHAPTTTQQAAAPVTATRLKADNQGFFPPVVACGS